MNDDLIRERDRIVERVRGELRALVRERGQTQREVEKVNGFTRGYLSQVFQGHIAMTARHLFGTLLALEIPPQEFFERVLGAGGEDVRERLDRLEAKLERLESGRLEPGD